MFERPSWLTILTTLLWPFTESCCITGAGNSDVPLRSQWKVLTWPVRTALQVPSYLLNSKQWSSQGLCVLRAHLSFFLSDAFTFLIDQGSVIIVYFFLVNFIIFLKWHFNLHHQVSYFFKIMNLYQLPISKFLICFSLVIYCWWKVSLFKYWISRGYITK